MTEREEWDKAVTDNIVAIIRWPVEWERLTLDSEAPTEKSLKSLIGELDAIERECIKLADSIPS